MASTVLPLSLSAGANDFTVSGEIRSGFVEYDYSTPLDSRAFAAILARMRPFCGFLVLHAGLGVLPYQL